MHTRTHAIKNKKKNVMLKGFCNSIAAVSKR